MDFDRILFPINTKLCLDFVLNRTGSFITALKNGIKRNLVKEIVLERVNSSRI